MTTHFAPPLALTIAGLDPTCGAGVGADLKTFAAHHCYGLACVTALTAQNTHGVESFAAVEAGTVARQLECLLGDVRPSAVKIGMLANAAIVKAVAAAIRRFEIGTVVLDPVLRASSGAALLDKAGVAALREELLPLAAVATPNLEEAAELVGQAVENEEQMAEAARALRARGARAVVVTGGHLEKPVDALCVGDEVEMLGGERVRTPHTHGTGCTFSAAVAANLALGKSLHDAVVQAKAYVSAALRAAYAIGGGAGPLNHLFRWQEPVRSKNVDPAPLPEYTTR